MTTYNFRNFFITKSPIHNEEYVTNGFILIKKSMLKKSQLEYVNSFPINETTINSLQNMIKYESEKPIITEFIPKWIKENITDGYSGEKYNALIMERDRGYKGCSENISIINIGINEQYYNFITALKCKLFIVNNDTVNPLAIYNSDNEFVGILLPIRSLKIEGTENYTEYLNRLEKEKQEHKELSKKCLYISDNKAVVRHKELTCIADIVKDEEYKNLYVEPDYINNFGEVFINYGFIYMGTGRTIDKDSAIKRETENLIGLTFEVYKNYITKCLNNNQFINVAEIKLMELAGEPTEYIQTLTEHRQNYLNRKTQENKEREEKRQQEEQDYIGMKNAEADEQIKEAEQNIINRNGVKNKDITIYKESRYNSNTISIMNYLMKKYDIKVPLKTQGWINNALAGIFYDDKLNQWIYNYYTSSANSTVFIGYLNELIQKVNEKNNKVA
jgi:hypothetical protein